MGGGCAGVSLLCLRAASLYLLWYRYTVSALAGSCFRQYFCFTFSSPTQSWQMQVHPGRLTALRLVPDPTRAHSSELRDPLTSWGVPLLSVTPGLEGPSVEVSYTPQPRETSRFMKVPRCQRVQVLDGISDNSGLIFVKPTSRGASGRLSSPTQLAPEGGAEPDWLGSGAWFLICRGRLPSPPAPPQEDICPWVSGLGEKTVSKQMMA